MRPLPRHPRAAARVVALAAALALLPPAPVAAQLLEADVRISVRGDEVRVEAAYRLGAAGGAEVRLDALRVPGRRVRVEAARLGSAGPDSTRASGPEARGPVARLRLEALPGLYRVRGVAPRSPPRPGEGGPAAWEVRVEYVATGEGDRVPLFVPTAPAGAAGAPIRIRVTGVPADRSLADAFPRMRRAPDGALVARVDHVPSFLVLPGPAALPFNRTADVLVVLVVLAATGWWLRWRRRRPAGDG